MENTDIETMLLVIIFFSIISCISSQYFPFLCVIYVTAMVNERKTNRAKAEFPEMYGLLYKIPELVESSSSRQSGTINLVYVVFHSLCNSFIAVEKVKRG